MGDTPAASPFKTAFTAAGLTIERFADEIGVDAKTVRRWLQGRIPYPRHRVAISRILDVAAHQLWPDLPATATDAPDTQPAPAAPTDPVTGYPTQPASPSPFDLIAHATRRIDISQGLLPHDAPDAATTGLHELLNQRARAGLIVRVLVLEADRPFAADTQFAIRAGPVRHPLIRADDQLLLALAGFTPAEPYPMLHIQRHTTGGLFDRILASYQADWDAAQPITPGRTHPDTNADQAEDSPPAHAAPSAAPPRRWPRRD